MEIATYAKTTCTVESLKKFEDLAKVPDDQLEWLISVGSCVEIEEGEQLFKPGDPIDELRILFEGSTRWHTIQQGQRRNMGEFNAPIITGVLPYSRLTHATGYSETLTKVHLLAVHRDRFPEMIKNHHELTAAFVHNMTNRVRSYTALQQQNEKLMSLGKLSAGLAHELNNPSSAVVRSARELKKHLKAVPESFKQVIKIKMTEEEVDIVNKILFDKIEASKGARELSLMERTELEDDLAMWLEDHGVEDGYEISENLVDFGFTEDDLETVFEHTTKSHFVPVVNWINNNLVTDRMVAEIEEASNRISELVSSVKSYSHMDQSQEKQPVDVHLGIKNTVTMLAHKVKKYNLQIDKQLQEDLPAVMGFPGEMNQVFTNILDNAIDALADVENGKIVIKTVADKDFVKIYFRDNGTGIPEDIIQRIFDPFFTTKAIGQGTGMGLDVVKKIIDRHRGKVEVTSSSDGTEFCLCLPIRG